MYEENPQEIEEFQQLREQLELLEIRTDIEERLDQDEDWDYAQVDTKIATHCFHTYPAMMIPQVARRLIEMYSNKDDVMLDPFCGSGTVLVESKIAGLSSYGIDLNPLAGLLSRVKTTPLDIADLQERSISLLNDSIEDQRQIKSDPDFAPIPDFFNIDYWFKPCISRQLSALRSRIFAIEDDAVREFFLVAFSETVREVSYTRNSEFKLYRIPKEQLEEHNPNVIKLYFDKVYRNISGMREFLGKTDANAWVKVLQEDTRKRTSLKSGSINLVVTSPPYGDSRTTVAYGQFSRLSLQWIGLPYKEVKDIDRRSLGGRRFTDLDSISDLFTLKEALEKIADKDAKRALDVSSFYHDLMLCFREINRVSALGAKACFVVGNRTVKGVRIPTDSIVVELGEKCGFTHLETFHRNIPNKRMPSKNSPSNVQGEVGDTMTKEHILVLEKTGGIDGSSI